MSEKVKNGLAFIKSLLNDALTLKELNLANLNELAGYIDDPEELCRQIYAISCSNVHQVVDTIGERYHINIKKVRGQIVEVVFLLKLRFIE